MSMRATGRRTKRTAKAAICMLMEPLTRANGKKTSSMVRELRPGPTERSMRANTLTGKSMAMGSLSLLTEVCTMGNLCKTRLKEKANMCGLMVRHMKASGSETRWKAMEYYGGGTAKSMKVTSKTTRETASGNLAGEMADFTRATGRRASSMGLENSQIN